MASFLLFVEESVRKLTKVLIFLSLPEKLITGGDSGIVSEIEICVDAEETWEVSLEEEESLIFSLCFSFSLQGRAVALFFAREGCNVTIAHLPVEQSDADDVKKLVAEAPMGTKEILTVAMDLKSFDDCKKLVEKHVEKWGNTINIVVNNAAMQVPCPNFEEIDLNVTTDTFATNIIGMVSRRDSFSISTFAISVYFY